MTMLDISDDDRREPHRWVVSTTTENSRPRYLGQINKIAAPQVPDRCHQDLISPRCKALFLTDKGHWAKTPEEAAELLANTEAPSEFIATGALLGLFSLSEAPEESRVKPWSDYRVFQNSDGFWNAEELRVRRGAS